MTDFFVIIKTAHIAKITYTAPYKAVETRRESALSVSYAEKNMNIIYNIRKSFEKNLPDMNEPNFVGIGSLPPCNKYYFLFLSFIHQF